MPTVQTTHAPGEILAGDFTSLRMPLERLSPPDAGEIHAWFLDLPLLAQSLRVALDGHVGPGQPAAFTPGQLKFARRFFLRLLIGAYLGLPGKSVHIRRGRRGKPALDASVHTQRLQFSMAKSGPCVLAGFSSTVPLGVDLEPAERRARQPLALAHRYFSATERAGLEALPPAALDAAFLRTWACKEAVVKASGEGIANQLCRFSVETDPARPAALLSGEGMDPGRWTLAVMRPVPEYLGAVAAPVPDARIRGCRLLPAEPAAA